MDNQHSLRVFSCIVLIASLIAACKPSPTPTPTVLTLPPTLTPYPPVVIKAVNQAAEMLGVTSDMVSLVSLQKVDWDNSCLNLPLSGEECLEGIRPGYQGILSSAGEEIEFRSDEKGATILLLPRAVQASIHQMAADFDLDAEGIKLESYERIEWADSCLELAPPGQVCSQELTPGYRVSLNFEGEEYQYHTNHLGDLVLLAYSPASETEAYIEWSVQATDICKWARVTNGQVEWQPCNQEENQTKPLTEKRAEDFLEFTTLFKPFQALTPAGELNFNGGGEVTATPFQQRMIAAWTARVFLEASGEEIDPLQDLVFTYQKENNQGLCERVEVFTYGELRAISCAGDTPAPLGHLRLLSSQLQILYQYQSQLLDFQQEVTTLGPQETETTRMFFYGFGEENATDIHKDWISRLAEEGLSQLKLETQAEELEAARLTLWDYFEFLMNGDYTQAASLFAGDIQHLRESNPDIPGDNHVALFEAACTRNGFLCDLSPLNLVYARQISENRFLFVLELQTTSGELFTLGPCCGADEESEPPQTQFEFYVVKIDGAFKVENLPIYMP